MSGAEPIVAAELAPEIIGSADALVGGLSAADMAGMYAAADAAIPVGSNVLAFNGATGSMTPFLMGGAGGLLGGEAALQAADSVGGGLKAPVNYSGYGVTDQTAMEKLGAAGGGINPMQASGAGAEKYVGFGDKFMPAATQSAKEMAANQGFMDRLGMAMSDPKNIGQVGQQGMKMMGGEQPQPQRAPMGFAGSPDMSMPRQAKSFTSSSPYAQFSNFGQGFNPKPMKKTGFGLL